MRHAPPRLVAPMRSPISWTGTQLVFDPHTMEYSGDAWACTGHMCSGGARQALIEVDDFECGEFWY